MKKVVALPLIALAVLAGVLAMYQAYRNHQLDTEIAKLEAFAADYEAKHQKLAPTTAFYVDPAKAARARAEELRFARSGGLW